MRVPEILGWLLEDVSAIRLYCGQDQREEVAAFFKKTFDELWVKAVEEVAGGYYIDDPDFVDMFPNYNASCTTEMEETGVLVRLPSLVVEYNGGDHYVDARAVLEKALYRFEKQYPQVSYHGYILEAVSDVLSGEVNQWEEKSENCTDQSEVFDFIGKALRKLEDNDKFYDTVMETFIGDYESFEFEESIPKVIRFAYEYKDWVDPEKFVQNFLKRIKEESEEDYEEMCECISKIRKGIWIAEDESEDDDLPEGLLEALEAFEAADVYEAKLAEDGVLSTDSVLGPDPLARVKVVDTSYPRIELMAQKGDPRALEILDMLKEANCL